MGIQQLFTIITNHQLVQTRQCNQQ